MFGAIGRYFRALGYLLIGKVDAARMSISQNPNVVCATFDSIIHEKKRHIRQCKDTIEALLAQEEKKRAELKNQSEEVAKLAKLKEGAAVMARKVVQRLAGDIEAVKKEPEYITCQSAFQDFTSTLDEKETRCAELEEDIKTLASSITGHKTQIQSFIRELEKVDQEKHETVADIITAREERELADMVSGISKDRSSVELQEMRDLRAKAKATKRIEEEFLQYATESASSNEFDALIGLTKKTDKPDIESEDCNKIPEA